MGEEIDLECIDRVLKDNELAALYLERTWLLQAEPRRPLGRLRRPPSLARRAVLSARRDKSRRSGKRAIPGAVVRNDEAAAHILEGAHLSDSAFSSSGDEGDGCTARERPPPLLDPLELPGADDVRTGGCGDSEDETTQATAPLPSGDDAAHILLMLGSGGSGGARTCAFCATGEVAPLSGPEACVLWRCQLCGQQACHEQCCKGRIEGVWGADLGAPKHACPTCCEKHKVAVQAEANTLRKELEAAVADVVAREPLATRLAALRQRERGLASDDALALLE